ncbi:MAG: hypothetical protein WCF06_00635, partial [Nitrososphaeraceae archaeon]
MWLVLKYYDIGIATFVFVLILFVCIHIPYDVTAQQQQQQNSKTIKYFDKILAIDPNNADAIFFKGAALASLRKSSEAFPFINKAIILSDKALAIDPNNVDLLSIKGRSLNRLGYYKQAIIY